MESAAGHKSVFSFGLFEAHPATGQLLRQNERVRLQDQPFRMLVLLLERPGAVITREELREKLWPQNTFVEFDNGLNVAVKKIRDALGDNADNPRFVETLPRRGYRFIAPVAVQGPIATADDVRAVEEPAPVQAVPHELPAVPPPIPRFPYYAAAAVIIGLAIGGSLVFMRIRPASSVTPVATAAPGVEVAPRRSVAVMEFQNVSGHSENAWLSTAIPEMLSTELAAGEKLHLIPGEDVARVKRELHLESSGNLARAAAVSAGKNLKVDILVVGSYTAMGPVANRRVRVDLRLQDATNGEIVAEIAETGTEEHLFELISQAGSHVRDHLGVPRASPTEEAGVRASVPTTPEAARLYAEGLARLRILDAVGARDLLVQAVVAEPSFPLSHMGLASALRTLGYDQKARLEAKKAFDLSASLPRVDRLRIEGRYHEMLGEMDQAIAAYRSLFALSPDSLEDGLLLASAQSWAGKQAEALATVDALRRLPEPLSQDPRIDIQQAKAHGLDTHRYLELARRAQEKASLQNAPLLQAKAETMECNGLHTLGQPEEAIKVCEKALSTFSEAGNPLDRAETLRFLGDIHQQQGQLAEALDFHGQALKIDQESGNDRGCAVSLNQMAIDYESQGDSNRAERLYRRAYSLFLKVGNRTNAVVLASNVGGTLLSQGKLSEAEKFFEQSLHLARELGATDAEQPANNGLAQLDLLRGRLQSARHRMETAVAQSRKGDNPFTLVVELGVLSEILSEQGDATGAGQSANEALDLAEKSGAKGEAADSRLALADLELDDGNPLQAETLVRQALSVFQSEKMRDDELQALLSLSRSLLMQGKRAEAQAVVTQARRITARSQNPASRLQLTIAASRATAADSGEHVPFSQIRRQLRDCVSTAHGLGLVTLEFEARLALAEIEVDQGYSGAGRDVAALENDARRYGLNRVARRSATLRNRRS